MPARLSIFVLCFVAVAASLLPAENVASKGGCCFFNGFRISGGDLPDAITIPQEEVLVSTSGLGSWYTDEPKAMSPEPSGLIYRVEILGIDIDHEEVVFDERYRMAPDPMLTMDNGAQWAHPAPEIRQLLDRYIDVGKANIVSQVPSFAEALRASVDRFGAEVIIGDERLEGDARSRAENDIADMTAVSFGVQATLVGQRDLSITRVEVRFARGTLSLNYVPPGIIAPYGLLMVPRTTQSWALTTWIDPPGYSQTAFTVPTDFDEFMNARGSTARTNYEIKQARAIPLLEAKQYEPGYEHTDVILNGHVIGHVSPDAFTKLCDGCDSAKPVEPFTGEPLIINAWWKGYDPFPEAVKPTVYTYYPSDASGRGLGVVVTTTTGCTGNASLGGFESPVYTTPDIDQEIASLLAPDQSQRHRGHSTAAAAAFAAGIAVLFGGVLTAAHRIARRR